MITEKDAPTTCCALVQIKADNNITREALQQLATNHKNGGYRAVFVITMEDEPALVENLKALEFEKITEFHRRVAYPNTMLSMWIKKF